MYQFMVLTSEIGIPIAIEEQLAPQQGLFS